MAARDFKADLAVMFAAGMTISDCFAAMGEHQADTEPTAQAYIEAAEGLDIVSDGVCEIDGQGGGVASLGDDGGAYVLAWVWVSDEDAGLPPDEPENETPSEEEDA